MERAVEDLISIVEDKTLGTSVYGASVETRGELRRHYNGLMYQSILSCIKSSLYIIKKRACAKVDEAVMWYRAPGGVLFSKGVGDRCCGAYREREEGYLRRRNLLSLKTFSRTTPIALIVLFCGEP